MPFSLHDEVQALVLDARERARRVEREWRQHGLDFLVEMVLEPAGLLGGPVPGMREADARGFHGRCQHIVQQRVLLVDQARRALVDRRQLFGQGQRLGPCLHRAQLQTLLQARDADLEEFIEVAARDAEEAHALEERERCILALLQHALIELEKAQLAIAVELRGLEVWGIHRPGLALRAKDSSTRRITNV